MKLFKKINALRKRFFICDRCNKRIFRNLREDMDFNQYFHKKCWIKEFEYDKWS